MGTEKHLQFGVFLIDMVLLTAFVCGFYYLMRYISPESVNNIQNIPWLVLVYIIGFVFSYILFPSLIHLRFVKSEAIITRVVYTCFMMLLFISLILVVSRPFANFPRKFLLYSMSAYLVFLMTERLILRKILLRIRANKGNTKTIVLVGNEGTVHHLYEILKTPVYGYHIAGFFYDGECDNDEIASMRLGGVSDIYGWISTHPRVNEIYGYFPKEQQDTINMMSKFCDNHLIRFYYIPAINVFKGNMSISFMEDTPVIARREEPLRKGRNKLIKRVFDIIFSLCVLILVFPWILILVAIMIRIQSPGSIFFLQERTGLDGKIFKCIKFRSMHANNDADEVQATKDDPRKFPFGNFMRRTNIDEIPQFFNVLVGDMSVVGPRPHMLKHTDEYSKLINHFMVRHFAKPGITGLAQVNGFRGETRYIDQMEGRVKKDIEYIENWTFLLDIKIILKTIANMFGKEEGNAY
jgi:putative colanic acid biosynthesis UDP-glucose lipid carrier transferase